MIRKELTLIKVLDNIINDLKENELLRWVTGWENDYAVTQTGRVFSFKGSLKNSELNSFLDTKRDYKLVHLVNSRLNKNRIVSVHRLVAETFLLNPNNFPMVNHKNGVKTDNHVDNLAWCTYEHNMQHASAYGLCERGSKHHNAKLDEKQVIEIREKYKNGATIRYLSEIYNVGRDSIKRIINNTGWIHCIENKESVFSQEKQFFNFENKDINLDYFKKLRDELREKNKKIGSGYKKHSPDSLIKAFNAAIEAIDIEETLSWIPGFEDYYAVTDKGKVFSFSQRMGLLKLKLNKSGYSVLGNTLRSRDGKNISSLLVHRLVAQTFIPNPKNLPFINHKNGIKTDNKASNLEWCTHDENMAHAVIMGLLPNKEGIRNPRAKLNEKDVIDIRNKYHIEGISQSKLSKEYKISKPAVKLITQGKNWSHVPMPSKLRPINENNKGVKICTQS